MINAASEPSQRLNVDLPKSQYFALKSHALHHDTTVSQLLRDALRGIVEYDEWFKAKVHVALQDPAPPWTKRRGRPCWPRNWRSVMLWVNRHENVYAKHPLQLYEGVA